MSLEELQDDGAGRLHCADVKLLVIEDDLKLARLLTRVLQEEGYVVDGCSKGEPGLRQASSGLYDLVVLDWMLPDLDGLSLCRRLRELGASLPILMLTSRAELSERVMALDAGVDDYVVKPFEIEELVARIRALLRRIAGLGRTRVGALELDPQRRRVTLGVGAAGADRARAGVARVSGAARRPGGHPFRAARARLVAAVRSGFEPRRGPRQPPARQARRRRLDDRNRAGGRLPLALEPCCLSCAPRSVSAAAWSRASP